MAVARAWVYLVVVLAAGTSLGQRLGEPAPVNMGQALGTPERGGRCEAARGQRPGRSQAACEAAGGTWVPVKDADGIVELARTYEAGFGALLGLVLVTAGFGLVAHLVYCAALGGMRRRWFKGRRF